MTAVSCWGPLTQGLDGENYGMMSVPRIARSVRSVFPTAIRPAVDLTGRNWATLMMPPESLPKLTSETNLCENPGAHRKENSDTFQRIEQLRRYRQGCRVRFICIAERDFVREVENNDSLKVGLNNRILVTQSFGRVFHDRTVQVGGSPEQSCDENGQADSGDDMFVEIGKKNSRVESRSRRCPLTSGDNNVP